jgi:hypothetical protein
MEVGGGRMTYNWADDCIEEVGTGRMWRVLEKYLLPGKDTGYVVVCSRRACFCQIRCFNDPLGRLPHGISPEDRKAVVQWAVAAREEISRNAIRRACQEGSAPPFNPLDDEEE